MTRLVSRVATMTTDGNSDGFISQVNDVAKVDVRDMTRMSVCVNHLVDSGLIGRTNASLNLGTKTVHCNTVIEDATPGTAGNSTTIAFQAGSAVNAGTLDETGFPAIVYHFKTAVTTVANFETLIAASTHLAVLTPGTGANVLAVTVDEFAATAFAGGTSSEGTFSLLLEKTVDGTNFATIVAVDEGDFGEGNNLMFETLLQDANGMPTVAEQVRATLTAAEDANTFSVTVIGEIQV